MGLGYGRYILVRVLLLGGIVQYSTVQYSSTVQVRTKVCSVCMVVVRWGIVDCGLGVVEWRGEWRVERQSRAGYNVWCGVAWCGVG